ncbi:uncharacterized protein LOC108042461 [Drosophila rhopaloa]|uniref:Uncharacterized protein LOC108042461 n=2 Tax=Drosophila rhopaloa TaxID=1041015 RepID=A0A6P4EMK1_DRORH|nr:uncharacterized protein LOC108042461 [Drosophila rhopaloa]XP_016976257.1 uncharacterized protein LOC108042461 [Drosophila rhopaloa]XP_016976258.1 uncharacterized protein LOC108042461 [Drosophila rhopaloa]
MSRVTKGFARLINPGVVLNPELNQKIAAFETMSAERSELDRELGRLRKKQDETEDNLAEALAEDEFQCNLRGQSFTGPNEDELQEILRSHLSGIINKLATKYERLVYLDADIRKLKGTIEKAITVANEESAAAAAM